MQVIRSAICGVLVSLLALTPVFAQGTVGKQPTQTLRSNVVGSVKREDGTPIAGAGVELLGQGGEVIARGETGGDGAYSMPCVPHGRYQIRLETPGYQGATRVMPVGGPGVQVDWIFGENAKRPLAVATPGGGACAADGSAIADATPRPSASPEGESWWWRNRYWIGGGGLAVVGIGVTAAALGGGGGGGSRSSTPSE